MRSQRAVTDLRHWLSNKFFVVGENTEFSSKLPPPSFSFNTSQNDLMELNQIFGSFFLGI